MASVEASNFSLPEETKIICYDGPPVCALAERYFIESITQKKTEIQTDVPVDVFCIHKGDIFLVNLHVRRLLIKKLGENSGIILDEGILQSYVAAKRKNRDFMAARPLQTDEEHDETTLGSLLPDLSTHKNNIQWRIISLRNLCSGLY